MYSNKTIEELNDEEVYRLIPLLVYLGVIVATGIPGNTLVCWVYRNSSKKSVSRYFIWWLAVIDVISCFVLFLEIVNVVKQHTYTNAWLCKFTIFLTIWPVITSGFGLSLISIDRFRRVCRPLKKQITYRMARIMCLTSAVIAFLFSWPALELFGRFERNISEYNLTSSMCTFQNKYQGTVYMRVYNSLLWFLFVASLIFLSVMYTLIGKKVCSQMKRQVTGKMQHSKVDKTEFTDIDDTTTTDSNATSKSNQNLCKEPHRLVRKMSTISTVTQLRVSSQRQAKARKSAFIMFLISFIFIVSFLPYLVLRTYEAFDANFVAAMSDNGRATYTFFLRSYFLNCAINPFIYCACAASFRRDVHAFLQKISMRGRG